MPVTKERRDLYRDLILGAAEREFARVGFADAKMTSIAKEADVSLATVYKTFPGKLDIWNDLHARRMSALLSHVDERVAAADSPLEQLLSGISGVAEFLTAHDAYLDLSLGAGSGWLSPGGATDVQRTVWGSGLDMIAAGIGATRAAHQLGDLRPRIAAGLVVSALQVWLADWVDADRDRPAVEVVAELERHLRSLLSADPSAQPSPRAGTRVRRR